MSIQAIEGIRVNDGPIGEAFRCKIFQMNLEVGYDKIPTSLTLNLIAADGTGNFTNLPIPPMDYTYYHKIRINDTDVYMYLVKKSIRTVAESKTLALEFVDGSHILDRVFVGMVNKHTTNRDQMLTGDSAFSVPVCCPDCHGDPYADLTTTGKYINQVRQVSFATGVPIGNNIEGGFIFLGEEGYTQSDCDIGEFSYTFHNLVYAAAQIGVELQFSNAEFFNHFRRTHTGSLRKVLQAWCAELNYTFSYDFLRPQPKVLFIDLGDGYRSSNIENIYAKLNNINKSSISHDNQAVITDINWSESLKETTQQYQTTFFQSSNKKASNDREVNYLQHFLGLYVDDIVSYEELGKSYSVSGSTAWQIRNGLFDYAEFFTSMSLARVNQYAADIYNCMRGYLGYLGYNNWVKIPDGTTVINGKAYDNFKQELLGSYGQGANSPSSLLQKYWKNIFRMPDDMQQHGYTEPTVSNNMIVPAWFDVYLAVTPPDYGNDKQLKPHTREYEKTASDNFVGQYFYSYARPKQGRTCTKSMTYDVKVSYEPSPQIVYSPSDTNSAKNITKVNVNAPWYDLIGPRYGMQSFLWPQAGAPFGVTPVWTHTPIRVIKREAKWTDRCLADFPSGVKKGSPLSELTIDTCGNDIFEKFKPMISNLNASLPGAGSTTVAEHMREIFKYLKSITNNPVGHNCTDDVFSGYQYDMVVCPKVDLVKKFMDVLPVMYYKNNQWNFNHMKNTEEETYINNVPEEGFGDQDCQPFCDVQKAMIADEACDCDPILFGGPGDLSAQDISFQNELFSPQLEPHPDGLYNYNSYGITLGFCRDNPWKDFQAHGTKAFDTYLNVALPVSTFREVIEKSPYSGFPNSKPVPTQSTTAMSVWFRANFKETISITYNLPKETSVKNNFEAYDSQGYNHALPGNVAKINVHEKDVTSMLNIVDGNCGGDAQVINIYLPSVGFVDLDTYHNLYTNLLNNSTRWPRQTVSASFIGMNLGEMQHHANILDGLTSWSISMSSDGYTSQLAWANRPRSYPSQELSMIALKPEILGRV